MVSYFMQKDTDDDITTSNDGWEVADARNLDQSALLSALRSDRDSVFDLEATATAIATETYLQLNNTTLPDIAERRDALVGDIHNRVAVFDNDRVVLKAALRQLQRDIRYESPGHAKVAKDLDYTKEGEIDLGYLFRNPLPPPPVTSFVADYFAARPAYPPPFFLFFLTSPQK